MSEKVCERRHDTCHKKSLYAIGYTNWNKSSKIPNDSFRHLSNCRAELGDTRRLESTVNLISFEDIFNRTMLKIFKLYFEPKT